MANQHPVRSRFDPEFNHAHNADVVSRLVPSREHPSPIRPSPGGVVSGYSMALAPEVHSSRPPVYDQPASDPWLGMPNIPGAETTTSSYPVYQDDITQQTEHSTIGTAYTDSLPNNVPYSGQQNASSSESATQDLYDAADHWKNDNAYAEEPASDLPPVEANILDQAPMAHGFSNYVSNAEGSYSTPHGTSHIFQDIIAQHFQQSTGFPSHLRRSYAPSAREHRPRSARQAIVNYLKGLSDRINSHGDVEQDEVNAIAYAMRVPYDEVDAGLRNHNSDEQALVDSGGVLGPERREHTAAPALVAVEASTEKTKVRITKRTQQKSSSRQRKQGPTEPEPATDWTPDHIPTPVVDRAATAVKGHHRDCIKRLQEAEIKKNLEKNASLGKPYPCTLGCGESFRRSSDWKRHAHCQHPQYAWICDIDKTVASSAGRRCSTCGSVDICRDVARHRHKSQSCKNKGFGCRAGVRNFRREDKFREHFRHFHWGLSPDPAIESSRYTVDRNWKEVCGFCGQAFTEFEAWAEHVLVQLQRRKNLVDWKEPWVGDTRPSNCEEVATGEAEDTNAATSHANGKRPAGTEGNFSGHSPNAPQGSFLGLPSGTTHYGPAPGAGAAWSTMTCTSDADDRKAAAPSTSLTYRRWRKTQHPLRHHQPNWFLHFQSICGHSFLERPGNRKLLDYSDIDNIARHLSLHHTSPLAIALRQISPDGRPLPSMQGVTAVFDLQDEHFVFRVVPSWGIERRVLGRGGSSTVYSVRLLGDPTVYAEKSGRTGSANILDETRLLMSLRHPHLVRMQAMTMTADSISMLLSPVAERSLEETLRDPGMLETIRIGNFGCLAAAIEYIHSQGVSHGDVKPGNILVVEQARTYRWLLTDFNASRRFNVENLVFTPMYAAPEVHDGNGCNPSDIFSLGATYARVLAAIVRLGNISRVRSYCKQRKEVIDWLHELQKRLVGQSNGKFLTSKPRWLDQMPLAPAHVACVMDMLSERIVNRPTATEVLEIFHPLSCCSISEPLSGDEPKTDTRAVGDTADGGENCITIYADTKAYPGRSLPKRLNAPIYKELSTDRSEVRLVELFPPDGDTLCCRLRVRSLDDGPHYEALSYVWGDVSDKAQIMLNGKHFTVTRSLHTALRALRCESHSRFLWIDALCMNQMDVKERSSQVRMMHRIYGQACQVVVWLKGLDNVWLTQQQNRWRWGVPCVSCSNCQAGNACEDNRRADFELDHGQLYQIAVNRYWSRTWTFQEIALARKATVVYEDSIFPWKTNAGKLLKYCVDQAQNTTLDVDTISYIGYTAGIITLAASLPTLKHEELSWHQLLRLFSRQECSDPRDRIYALSALVPASKKLGIWPDYSLSHQEVLLNVAIAELQSGTIDILTYGGTCNAGRLGLPSWVPDWSAPRSSWASIAWHGSRRGWPVFQTAGNDKRSKVFFQTLGAFDWVLSVTGVVLDVIAFSWIAPIRRVVTGAELYQETASPITEGDSRLQNLFGIFWTSYVSGTVLEDNNAWQMSPSPKVLSFMESFSDRMGWFYTAKGLIGLGPRMLQAGDIVVIIDGASVPVILRSEMGEGETYSLVGSCYIDGIMDGENKNMIWQGKWQEFRLR